MVKKEQYEYDPKRRRLAKIYSKQKLIMGIGNSFVIPLFIIAVFYFFGIFKNIADWSLSKGGNFFGVILFVIVLSLIFVLVEFPLKLYATHFYEHKYKLSKHTLGTWFIDFFKELILEFALLIPMGSIIAFLAINFKFWWIYASLVNICFSIFSSFIHPIIIVPFMYKLQPYKDKIELKKILEIIKRVGVSNIKKINIMKESEKSTKVNAMFTGIGKTKSILLYDNLLNHFTKREVRTVIGHELGHHVNKDIIKSEIFSAVQTIIVLFLVDKLIRNTFGLTLGIPLELYPLLSGSLIIIGFIIMPISTMFSRHIERKADQFALDHIRDPIAQISTDKKLMDMDLSDENPNKFVEFWFYSHPCGKKRIKMAKEWLVKKRS